MDNPQRTLTYLHPFAMAFSLNALVAFLALATVLPGLFALDYGFPYGKEKVRGVNLGGWLVIEVCVPD